VTEAAKTPWRLPSEGSICHEYPDPASLIIGAQYELIARGIYAVARFEGWGRNGESLWHIPGAEEKNGPLQIGLGCAPVRVRLVDGPMPRFIKGAGPRLPEEGSSIHVHPDPSILREGENYHLRIPKAGVDQLSRFVGWDDTGGAVFDTGKPRYLHVGLGCIAVHATRLAPL
jgi:hypothetical protein